MATGITSLELSKKLYDAGLVPERTCRIIIDVQVNEPVKIYYETYADDKIKDIDLAELITGNFQVAVDGQLKPKDETDDHNA